MQYFYWKRVNFVSGLLRALPNTVLGILSKSKELCQRMTACLLVIDCVIDCKLSF